MRTTAHERSYMLDGLVPAHADGGPPLKVVPDALCTRCGACDPICPPDVIRFDERRFPVIETEGCIACGLCVVVCPGAEYDFPAESRRRFGEDPWPALGGSYRSAWLCRSTRAEVCTAGSGGGVVTQILIGLLEQGVIDGAVTTGAAPGDPLTPIPVLCRTPEELLATAGSKYCVVPQAEILRDVRRTPGRFAFVGVGCQIEGLRRLESLNRRLARREILTIGLACHGTLEKEATTDVLRRRGIPQREVRRFRYRGGAFPGKFQAELPDGIRDLHRHEYKDSAYNYLFRLYTPPRCLDCTDFSAESTDLSVADHWARDERGEYLHPEGASLVLCRTERGERIVRELVGAGVLSAAPIAREDAERSFAHLRREKRIFPFLRRERARRAGRPAPNDHLPVPEIRVADRIAECLHRATFAFSHHRLSRRILVWIFFSPFGDFVTGWNVRRKRWLWRLRARGRSSRLQQDR